MHVNEVSMDKLIISFLGIGISLFLVNVTRFFMGFISLQEFAIGLQLLVIGSFWLTYSLYRRPDLISWFGKNVESNSYSNITIGKCFNLGFALFGFFINLGILFF